MTKQAKKIKKVEIRFEKETSRMHKKAVKLIQEQIEKHSLGKLSFLSFVGTRPWGFGKDYVDYDYRGVYTSKEDKSYQVFISNVFINNYAKDIILTSLERFLENNLRLNIHTLIFINSPIIYASKDFLEFKKWINSNLTKKIYKTCQTKKSHSGRKDYLYDFFFIGNGISVLEQKRVIANLFKLNKKCLKIPFINKLIEEEKKGLPFKNKQKCEKVLSKLKTRIEKANKESSLPEEIDKKKFAKLKIAKKINHRFWTEEERIKRKNN